MGYLDQIAPDHPSDGKRPTPVESSPCVTHEEAVKLIWDIAELLRGPYRPPQYERVMLPMTVLRRFDCVLEPTKAEVLAEYEGLTAAGRDEATIERLLQKKTGYHADPNRRINAPHEVAFAGQLL